MQAKPHNVAFGLHTYNLETFILKTYLNKGIVK